MRRPKRFAGVEVGDRAGHAKNFVVGAGRKAELGHRGPQQIRAVVVELAMGAKLALRHVAVVPRGVPAKRLRWIVRAETTASRIEALDVPGAAADKS